MGVVERANIHRAVLWPYAGVSPLGEPRVSIPQQICCRWDQSNNSSPSPEQNPAAKPVKVFVNKEITLNSIMVRGCLEDIAGTGTGADGQPDLWIVTKYNETSDILGKDKTRSVDLTRYGSQLPEVV